MKNIFKMMAIAALVVASSACNVSKQVSCPLAQKLPLLLTSGRKLTAGRTWELRHECSLHRLEG